MKEHSAYLKVFYMHFEICIAYYNVVGLKELSIILTDNFLADNYQVIFFFFFFLFFYSFSFLTV